MIVPAVMTADNAEITVDLQGCDGCEIVLMVGVGGITFNGTNKIEFVLNESDDDSTYTAVPDGLVNGVDGTMTDGIIKALTAAHAAAAVYRFGYVGYKRYLQLLADFSGTHGTGTPISAVAIKRTMSNPAADQA